jgi:putative Flp pilus-assembly TadE/G-like protein
MLISRFLRNRDAGVAPMLALAALPLFGFAGAAIDFSRASSVRSSMQAALDASALIMAKSAKNADANQLNADATQYFNANFRNPELQNLNTTAATSSTSSGYSATLSASGSIKSKFMGMLGFANLNIAVHSTASSYADGLGCVLSLNAHATGAVTGQGSTNVVLNGCSMYDNSDHATAMVAGGSAHITAYSVGVVGNLTGTENITTTAGVRTGVRPIYDPYAGSYFPAFGGCTDNNFTGKNTVTINPGVYCGGMKINAGAVVTLNPGIYYLDGGDLTVNGGGTLQGTGVTLVFTSKNRNGFATASINGNAIVNLTPPTTGGTAGIVVFGDRRMPVGTDFKFNGGANQYLAGAIYVPTGAISFAGGMGTSTSCTQLIGDTITFTGNSSFALNCNAYATKPFSPLVVKLTS